VIDLLNGVTVHARQGERSHYLPIVSSLTKSSKPIDIVKAFMDIYPFKTLYIADLNAIQDLENTGTSHIKVVKEINNIFPDLKLWVDAGINTYTKAKTWKKSQSQLILGSESFLSTEEYLALTSKLNMPFTLSLDFSSQGYLGPKVLIQNTKYWPEDIIIMTLEKVGANAGIDISTIQHMMIKTTKHSFYAAGGIRDVNDLLHLKQLKVKGALLASALHSQQISTNELQALDAEIKPEQAQALAQ